MSAIIRAATLALILCFGVAAASMQVAIADSGHVAASQAGAARSWTFSGRGTKRIGTLRLRRTATLRWTKSRGTLRITGTRGFRLLETRARRGHITVRPGTYRRLSVSAPGSWRITVRERR